jgi:hypothetical protein
LESGERQLQPTFPLLLLFSSKLVPLVPLGSGCASGCLLVVYFVLSIV